MEPQKELSNRWFFSFIAVILLLVSGWMAYDFHQSTQSIQRENVRRDLLKDSASGPGAEVQYLFNFLEPHFIHDLSMAQIEALSHPEAESEHYHIPGLTLADYKMDTLYDVGSSGMFFQSERAMWVENLRVEFSYTTLNVYVTSSYPQDSCEYRETLAHENQHVEIHRRLYEEYKKILEETVAKATRVPSALTPLTAASKEEGKEKIGRIISELTDPVFDHFKEALVEEQGKLDTRESYDELHSRCQHW